MKEFTHMYRNFWKNLKVQGYFPNLFLPSVYLFEKKSSDLITIKFRKEKKEGTL